MKVKKIKMTGFCTGNCGDKIANYCGLACYGIFGRFFPSCGAVSGEGGPALPTCPAKPLAAGKAFWRWLVKPSQTSMVLDLLASVFCAVYGA
jgi:hypothetical protein